MKTYRVQKEYTVWFEVEVEAEDELAAVEKADVEFSDGMGWETEGREQTGQYWFETQPTEIGEAYESWSGSLGALEDIVIPKRKLKAKAAELELPVQWVEKLEII